jgi:D-alanine-D-alanine ligase-like ATP-grasp enzyme
MQLAVAGIDLRQNVDGDWYCFEVNPSPAFTYYQEATDQPISRAIARLLADGSPGQRLS